jgi:hypothetical protein
MGIALNYAAQLEEELQRVQLPGRADKTIAAASGVEDGKHLDDFLDCMAEFNVYEDENRIGREDGNEESSTADEEDESYEQPPPDTDLQDADEAADGEGSKNKKIAIRKRVSMHRFQLHHILSNNKQCACIPKSVPNNYSFFGTVVSRGSCRNNWNFHFDILPCDEDAVVNISRGKLEVVQPGEEELPLKARDQARFDELGCEVTEEVERSPKKTTNKTLEDAFCSMEAKELKEASSFKYCWGVGDNQCLEWRIIPNAVWLHNHNDPFVYPDKMELHDPSIQDNELEVPDHV